MLSLLHSPTLTSIHATGKTIALTRWTLVGKVMSLLLNMLSRLVITFNFMAAVTTCSDFGAPKNKVWHCFHHFPIYFPWSDGTRCHNVKNLRHGIVLSVQWLSRTILELLTFPTDGKCRHGGALPMLPKSPFYVFLFLNNDSEKCTSTSFSHNNVITLHSNFSNSVH